jgi:hypothetical protein
MLVLILGVCILLRVWDQGESAFRHLISMLVLLMEFIYEIHLWDGFGRHDVRTTFHEDRLWHIKVIMSRIWKAPVLAVLKKTIYEALQWDGFLCNDILTEFYVNRYTRSSNIKEVIYEVAVVYIHANFRYDQFGHWSNIKYLLQQFKRL